MIFCIFIISVVFWGILEMFWVSLPPYYSIKSKIKQQTDYTVTTLNCCLGGRLG